jgi:hypothetical protein
MISSNHIGKQKWTSKDLMLNLISKSAGCKAYTFQLQREKKAVQDSKNYQLFLQEELSGIYVHSFRVWRAKRLTSIGSIFHTQQNSASSTKSVQLKVKRHQ